MRRVREVLRLRHALGMSDRSIAQSLGIGKTTVGEYVCRAKVIGITWPVPEEIDDAELERRLFTAPSFEEKPKRPPLDQAISGLNWQQVSESTDWRPRHGKHYQEV